VTGPAVSIAFFDLERGLHGTARNGATLLFEDAQSTVLPEGPRVERSGAGWLAELDGAFSLELQPVAAEAALGGVTAHVCEVTGTVGTAKVRCLGTVGETHTPPEWDVLDALRSISAVFDREHAFLAVARRPRGAPGHGQEEVAAWLLHGGTPTSVEDARISTEGFEEEVAKMPDEAWDFPVRTLSNKHRFPARDVLRARRTEVEVHHADLGNGYTAADWPRDFTEMLIGRVQDDRADGPSMVLSSIDTPRLWKFGPGRGPEIIGTTADLAWWLIGRGDGSGLVSSAGVRPELTKWR